MNEPAPRAHPELNWFSPLPPERSGIAEFTSQLAPWILRKASARFVGQTSTSDFPYAAAALADLQPSDINRSRLNVFNIGNNASFHDRLWQISMTAGGVVILHDARLQHLFGGIYLTKRNSREQFCGVMRSVYGIAGEAAASLMADGRATPETVADQYPLVELALRGAAGAVVHSDEALRIVRERIDIPVVKLNLPYDAGEAPRHDPRVAGRRAEPMRILLFGHIGPNRRVATVFRALACVVGRVPLRVDLVGDVWDERKLRDQAQALGIGRILAFHGHVADAMLDRHLEHADLVVNLRWPTMGEASYSQLRAFRHGIATMVTRAGWYGELPDDAVIHIAPGDDGDAIADALLRLANDRDLLAAYGQRGRELLIRDHSPERYVDELLSFARSVSGSIRPSQEQLASRVARELADMPDVAIDMILGDIAQRLNGGRDALAAHGARGMPGRRPTPMRT